MEKSKVTNPNLLLSKILLAIALFGVAVATLTELSHRYPIIMELCGGELSGCSDVTSSSFGEMFGVSVAYWGLLSYVAFIFVLLYAPKFVFPLAAALLGAELYFLWVMAAILETYCLFCLIQLGTVIALFIVTLLWARGQKEFFLPGRLWSAPVVAFLVFASLAAPVKFKQAPVAANDVNTLLTYQGDINAKVTVEIFSDFECPHCRKFEPEIDKLVKNHPDVLVIFRDFALKGHRISPVAVSYVNGVAFTQGREEFLKIRREMFENQDRLYSYLEKHLPSIEFTDELKSKIERKIAENMKRVKEVDVTSTPTMAIYRDGKLVQLFRGKTPYEEFSRFLKP